MTWDDDIVGPDVASAGIHVSHLIAHDAAARLDLEEALEASRYASHPYSSYPKEWPPLAEIVETRELPTEFIERYNASGGEGTALCGIFPEIRRAWASVDNSVFLWHFDKWDGHCSEYSAEEHAICAAGLARVKPGTFVEAIQYLLVLATPVELAVIGVCCTTSGDGLDPFAEISLQPLPEYKIPTDGVTMTCIACSDKGHIFLAGRDGHIYEMQYNTGSSRHKCCRKLCLTAGLGGFISRWVLPNVFKFGAVDPIIDMVVDNERSIIYARTEAMRLQVYDLGENGGGPFKKIAEQKNLVDPREAQYGGRRTTGSRAAAHVAKPSIVHIAPLFTTESKRLHLVAILSDGRRMYLSTFSGGNSASVGGSSGLSNVHNRPTCLRVIATRPSPPLTLGDGITFGAMSAVGRTQPEDLTLNVGAAFCSAGTLVLSDTPSSTTSKLLIVNRDPTTQTSFSDNFGVAARSIRALRELVSSLPIDGRLLSVADVLPLPDIEAIAQSLFSDAEAFTGLGESSGETFGKFWAKGDLPTQHFLPRRKIVAFSTMGLLQVAFNRPVDILKRLFESNAPRSQIEEFFNRFGSGEAAAMCLMLAAKLVYDADNLISNTVAEKATEAFEDPGIVGMPQLEGNPAMPSTSAPTRSFSMGQVVQDAEPVFSGAHEGLCLCASRLLFPLWELPVIIMQGETCFDDVSSQGGLVVCRLSPKAMKILEIKIRSLEQFLRSRRNKRRGLYGFVAGLRDYSGMILYGTGSHSDMRNTFRVQGRSANTGYSITPNKRQRQSSSSAELAAMEVRAMECLRRLLRRSSEALFLLQLVCHHNVARIVQGLNRSVRQKLVQLTFNQLVCSEEGDQIAIRLIAGLMEYYIGPDGKGTIHEISEKLKEGCPSYYSEADYKYFQAVEYLQKASVTRNAHERELLARDAFNLLSKVPESADLGAICKRFEELRFYEAVVRLPLQKAQALEAKVDAVNVNIDPGRRDDTLSLRNQCYEIVMNALRSLTSVGQKDSASQPAIDKTSRDNYIREIVQLSVQWPDAAFHEHLYKTMIDLGLENELLEYGGSDLVSFLQIAGRKPLHEASAVTSVQLTASQISESGSSIVPSQAKYLDLLARYYVLKRQHLLAAHVLYRLAERHCTAAEEAATLEQRLQYLSNAILQAKSAGSSAGSASSGRNNVDDGLLDMLEAKLSVLRFQMQIKDGLELIASRSENSSGSKESLLDDPSPSKTVAETDIGKRAREKAKELSLELKSITQLYNDYAVPFELWEICLEMLNFANYSGDADSKIVRETWARLLDQALSRGGVVEACSVVKRVGSKLYPGDGVCLPLNTLCLHLEKAALEALTSGIELVGDEEVARSLLAACKGAPEPVLSAYDQLLSNGTILSSPLLKLRLLRSVLMVLHEWAMSVLAHKLGTTTAGASFIFGGPLPLEHTPVVSQGTRDKITTLANRYMTEVRRLALPQSRTEPVYKGFRELEEKLMSSSSFRPL